jgi:outer membrane protein assembly factor BamB
MSVLVGSRLNLPSSHQTLLSWNSTSHHLSLQTNVQNLDPSLIWNRTYSQSSYDRGYSILECRDGGYAILGETRQEGIESRSDVWLLRVDESGYLLWNTTFGSVDDERGYDLVERPAGGFAFVGVRGGDMYFVETNSVGFHIRSRTLYAGGASLGVSIVACQTFGYALLGMISYNQTWLVRMNELDLVLWNHTYDMALSEGSDTLVECQDGGFAFMGTSNYYNTPDVMLFRTDQNGSVLWNQTYGESGDYFSQGLVECADGGFAFAGAKREYDEVEFNIWLVRTDPFGAMVWNTTYGDENEYGIANAIVETSSGGFALTGFEDSFARYYDALFLVTDPYGELLIDMRLGSFYAEVGHSIVECKDAGFAIVGEFYYFTFVYSVLLIRIPGPQDPIPLRNLWLGLALLLPIVVSVVTVVLTIWLLRSKSLASEKT